jgi:hypothetical protein
MTENRLPTENLKTEDPSFFFHNLLFENQWSQLQRIVEKLKGVLQFKRK